MQKLYDLNSINIVICDITKCKIIFVFVEINLMNEISIYTKYIYRILFLQKWIWIVKYPVKLFGPLKITATV